MSRLTSAAAERALTPERREALVQGALCALLILPVWTSQPLPLQDLPLHEQVVAILLEGGAWTGFPERLGWDATPRPYALVYFLWAALAVPLGLDAASRVLLSLALGGAFLAGAQLVRRADPGKGGRAWLVALFAPSWLYFAGFVQVLLALPLALSLLGRHLPADSPAQRAWLDPFLLLATYLVHPLIGFFCGLLLIPAVIQARTRWLPAGARLIALAAPSGLWTLGVALFGQARPLQPNHPLRFGAPDDALAALLGFPLSAFGGHQILEAPAPASILGALLALAWLLALAALAWPGPPRERSPAARALGASALAAVALGFIFPSAWRNGSLLAQRSLVLAFPLLLAWVPTRSETRATRLLTGLALALTLGVHAAAHRLAAAELRDLDPVLAAMEPGAATLPSIRAQALRSPTIRGRDLCFQFNAPLRYHVEQGGLCFRGALRLSTSPVFLRGDPGTLPFRYVILTREEACPPGFREVPTTSSRWRLCERDSAR